MKTKILTLLFALTAAVGTVTAAVQTSPLPPDDDWILDDEWDEILFAVNSEEDEVSGRIGNPSELQARIDEHPELLNVLPMGFPNYKPEDVKKHIDLTLHSPQEAE